MSNHFVHREPPDAKEKRERILRAASSPRWDEGEEEGKKRGAEEGQGRLPTRPLIPDRPEEEERAWTGDAGGGGVRDQKIAVGLEKSSGW